MLRMSFDAESHYQQDDKQDANGHGLLFGVALPSREFDVVL